MKDKFIEIYQNTIHREGAAELLAYLQRSDFFTAPASTRFHLARAGGLCEHSVHVYERLLFLCEGEAEMNPDFKMPTEETIAIVALLHDLCKIDFYKVSEKNVKNESGVWEKQKFYQIDEALPYGHGEKSVYIVSGFLRLTREEALAIRYHMGFSSNEFRGGDQSVGKAFELYPLAVLTHIADLQATYLDETT